MVTHAVSRLSYADYIIALDAHGQISEQGTFEHLQNSGGYLESLATKHRNESETPRVPATHTDIGKKAYTASPALTADAIRARVNVTDEEDDLNRPIGGLSTYKYYFSSMGWSSSLLCLFYTVLSGVAAKLTELLVTYWTNALLVHGTEINGLYLGLYGMLAAIGTIFWTVACYHFFLYMLPVSAEKLHARLLRAVMNASLSFFTSTDTGVTTNRFSQDMSIVDKILPFALIDLVVAVV